MSQAQETQNNVVFQGPRIKNCGPLLLNQVKIRQIIQTSFTLYQKNSLGDIYGKVRNATGNYSKHVIIFFSVPNNAVSFSFSHPLRQLLMFGGKKMRSQSLKNSL